MTKADYKWMEQALLQAKLAEIKDEVPIGAVIVKDDELIGFGHNKVISTSDPSAHAEISAIRQAAKNLQNYRLPGSTLYTTIEPCMMCAGTIIHARIQRVVFGATEPKAGTACSNLSAFDLPFLNHNVEIVSGVLERQCREIIQDFFQRKRVK
jgi:tRNA(adenine34) deaminase